MRVSHHHELRGCWLRKVWAPLLNPVWWEYPLRCHFFYSPYNRLYTQTRFSHFQPWGTLITPQHLSSRFHFSPTQPKKIPIDRGPTGEGRIQLTAWYCTSRLHTCPSWWWSPLSTPSCYCITSRVPGPTKNLVFSLSAVLSPTFHNPSHLYHHLVNIPEEYQEFHWSAPGPALPPCSSIYPFSLSDQRNMKECVQQAIQHANITPSISPASAIGFIAVEKKRRSLSPCRDDWAWAASAMLQNEKQTKIFLSYYFIVKFYFILLLSLFKESQDSWICTHLEGQCFTHCNLITCYLNEKGFYEHLNF